MSEHTVLPGLWEAELGKDRLCPPPEVSEERTVIQDEALRYLLLELTEGGKTP